MLMKEDYIAYLCPNINFDEVDFSECRSEEVIFFFDVNNYLAHLAYLALV